ncbi:YegP family protein [Herbidospora sp. RD11066]
MAGRFVISRDTAGAYRFKLVMGNGQTIAISETFTSRAACVNGIESVRRTAPEAELDDSEV